MVLTQKFYCIFPYHHTTTGENLKMIVYFSLELWFIKVVKLNVCGRLVLSHLVTYSQSRIAQLVNYRFVLPAQITVLWSIITEVMHIKGHLGYLDISFRFRPFDKHIEVHRWYYIISTGQAFIIDPSTDILVDPHSRVIDMLLVVVSSHEHTSYHKCGTRLKSHIISQQVTSIQMAVPSSKMVSMLIFSA